MTSYLFLFGASFLAATVMPFSSEVILFSMLGRGEPPLLLVLVATTGNSLGAVINWYLGRYLLKYQDRKWFYFSKDQLERMQYRFTRYGVWSLLFSWLPLGGDVLTCVAGIMRVPLRIFLPLVIFGKGGRYLVIMFFSL